MNHSRINAIIAQLDGFEFKRAPNDYGPDMWYIHRNGRLYASTPFRSVGSPPPLEKAAGFYPDYTEDLDEIIRVCSNTPGLALNPKRDAFIGYLTDAVGDAYCIALIHAPALPRCVALIKTLNLWEYAPQSDAATATNVAHDAGTNPVPS